MTLYEASFVRTITSTYGAKGEQWLNNLPNVIVNAAKFWQLDDLVAYPNLTYNYVLRGRQRELPIVLKLRCNVQDMLGEVNALQAFQGPTCVNLLDYNVELGAILLEQLVPGTALSKVAMVDDRQATQIAANVLQMLSQVNNKGQFKTLLQTLPDLSKNFEQLNEFLPQARCSKNDLLTSSNDWERLLHGDFHHDNILQSDRNWCVIDTEGLWGDVGYDLAVFIRNPLSYLVGLPNSQAIVMQRIDDLSKAMNYPVARLYKWTFLQATVSAYWSLEDGLEIGNHLALLRLLSLHL